MIRLSNSVFLLSLREAFIALLPYFVLRAIVVLVYFVVRTYFSDLVSLVEFFRITVKVLYYTDPLLFSLSIGLFFARNLGIPVAINAILGVLVFVSASKYFYIVGGSVILLREGADFYVIVAPIVTMYFVAFLSKFNFLRLISNISISMRLSQSLNSILYSFIAYFVLTGLFLIIGYLLKDFQSLSGILAEQSVVVQTLAKNVMSHIFWFLGMHGTGVYSGLFDNSYSDMFIFDNIREIDFFYIFQVGGGAGSTWALIIAIFIASKDQHARVIAKLSFVFSIFNVNEIIIYGLPIVLNRFFLIPFICVPLINFGIGYLVFSLGWIHANDVTDISWVVPLFINGYMLAGWPAVFLQFVLLVIGVLVYLPFVKMASRSQAVVLDNSLKQSISLRYEIDNQSEKSYLKNMVEVTQKQTMIRQELDGLTESSLYLAYQPKVDVQTGKISSVEALLRVKGDSYNGFPLFFGDIDQAGLCEVLDRWVVSVVRDDLLYFKKHLITPLQISINIFPITLMNPKNVDLIIANLQEFDVEIEVLETGFAKYFDQINQATHRLNEAGIKVAIDDFGAGYSSLSLLSRVNAGTVKMDKALLHGIESKKCKTLYKYICDMCHALDFKVVSEGIESKEQCDLVTDMGADYIQGWYYHDVIEKQDLQKILLEANSK